MYEVRLAVAGDLGAIRRIYRRTLSDWWFISKDQHLDFISRGSITVAINEGRVMGYVNAYPRKGGIYIAELAVEPSHQKRGIGTELLNRIKQMAGNRRIYVQTYQAVEFYEKNGFKVIETTKSVKNKLPLYIMDFTEKPLVEVFR